VRTPQIGDEGYLERRIKQRLIQLAVKAAKEAVVTKLAPGDIPEIERDAFWDYVDIRDEYDCWPFEGYVEESGYGLVRFKDYGCYKAHEIAYVIRSGDALDDGERVTHASHCPDRACCNPLHLVKVDQATYQEEREKYRPQPTHKELMRAARVTRLRIVYKQVLERMAKEDALRKQDPA